MNTVATVNCCQTGATQRCQLALGSSFLLNVDQVQANFQRYYNFIL